MRTTTQKTMRNLMLGIAVSAGLLTAGSMAANAAPQQFHDGRGEGREQGFHGNREPERRVDRGNERGFERGAGDGRYGRGFHDRGGYAYGGGYVGGGYGYVGTPVVESYIPPCPGDGYFWTAGYYNDGFWVPGVWTFRGNVSFDNGFRHGFGYGREFNRGFEHRDFDRKGFGEHRDAGREFHGRR